MESIQVHCCQLLLVRRDRGSASDFLALAMQVVPLSNGERPQSDDVVMQEARLLWMVSRQARGQG